MSRKFYRVDESDPPFPQIVECDADHPAATTFSGAKRELLTLIADRILHWRVIADETRALKKSDVKHETNRARWGM